MPKGWVSTGFGKCWPFKRDLGMSCCPVPGSLRSCGEREQGAVPKRVIKEPGSEVHRCWKNIYLAFGRERNWT